MMTQIEQNLAEYLGGFIRNRPDNLTLLQQYTGWQRMAQLELDRRATRLLDGLPDEELRVIASGVVDLGKLATSMAAKNSP